MAWRKWLPHYLSAGRAALLFERLKRGGLNRMIVMLALAVVLISLLPATCTTPPVDGEINKPAPELPKSIVTIDNLTATYDDGVVSLTFEVFRTRPSDALVTVDYQVELHGIAAQTGSEIPHGGNVVLNPGELRKGVSLTFKSPYAVALNLSVMGVHGGATLAGESNYQTVPAAITPGQNKPSRQVNSAPTTKQAVTVTAEPAESSNVTGGEYTAGSLATAKAIAGDGHEIRSEQQPPSVRIEDAAIHEGESGVIIRERRRDNKIGLADGALFIKLDMSGKPITDNTSGAWSCVQDRTTGLTWEVKSDDGGLHDKDWTYTWYNSDTASNGGAAGTAGKGACGATVAAGCDTEKFVAAVNAASLCGAKDWRLPTQEELQSLADLARNNPAVDKGFLPNTPSSWYWSSSPVASDGGYAWTIGFYHGHDVWGLKSSAFHVYLVRGQ